MKETDFYNEKVTECAEIKIDIKSVYQQRINDYAKMFGYAFGQKPAEFKNLASTKFFKDGFKQEGSKGKLTSVLENFVKVIKYYDYLGELSEIDRILNNFGITIAVNDNNAVNGGKVRMDKYDNLFKSHFPNDNLESDKIIILNTLLDKTFEALSAIEDLNNEIKDEHLPMVESKCETEGSVFKQAIGLKVKKLEGKDISEEVQKIEHKADEFSKAVEVI